MDKSNSVLTFWSWNGNMEYAEICKQIEDFAEQGIGGFFVHARAGLLIEYMESDWFEAIEIAITAAKRLGLEVWLYDEDGWPSGFAGGKVPELGEDTCMKSLHLSANPPHNGTIIAQYRKMADGSYQIDDTAEDLYAFYIVERHYGDLLNEKSVRAFIDFTHEVYKRKLGKHFGKTIKGIFTDEPQVAIPYCYTADLAKEYKLLFDEDFLSKLWLLFVDATDESSLFRIRYYETCAAMFYRAFTKQIADWCSVNNLQMTGHFAGEDGLCTVALNTGLLSNYVDMQIPGIDLLGRRLAPMGLVKQLSSIKNQFGKEQILSETFGCSGWNTSFSQFAGIWGYQAAMGVNLACLHLSAYSIKGIRKRDYPAFFSYQEPWWKDFNVLSSWMKCLNDFVSIGKAQSDIVVLKPLRSVFAEEYYSDEAKAVSNGFRMLVENLTDCQLPFDITDERILKDYAQISGGRLHIGDCSYGTLVISYGKVISRYTLDLIEQAKEAGIAIVFSDMRPVLVYEDAEGPQLDIIEDCPVVMNRSGLWRKYFECVDYNWKIRLVSDQDGSLAEDLIINSWATPSSYNIVVYNRSAESIKECNLVCGEGQLTCINPLTGAESRLEYLHGTPRLIIHPRQTVLLRLQEGKGNSADSKELMRQYIPFKSVYPAEDNVLTLDMARYRLDGKEYSEEMALVHLQREIFQNASESLEVQYRFFVQHVPDRIFLCAECTSEQIHVNGNAVGSQDGWFIDKDIARFNIAGLVQEGVNIVTIRYSMGKFSLTDTEGKFETERNRFFYPVEPESIYITGTFGVKAKGGYLYKVNHIRIENAEFYITTLPKIKAERELSSQGLWFYRGSIYANTDIEYDGKGRVLLSIGSMSAVYVKLQVNGSDTGILFFSFDSIDVTDMLVIGTNAVRAEIMISNRNTLGPHHHWTGEPNFVGVSVFNGRCGFEDGLLHANTPEITWTDDYSFVKNYIGELRVVVMNAKN